MCEWEPSGAGRAGTREGVVRVKVPGLGHEGTVGWLLRLWSGGGWG